MKTQEEIPTAEIFIEKNYYSLPSELEEITWLMTEFAKIHVKYALESAAENSRTRTNDESTSIIVDSQTILNAYPLDLIK